MKIACFSFTDNGKELGEKLKKINSDKYMIHHYENKKIEGGIKLLLNHAWKEYDGLIFISSTGIAVRMINPFIEDKTKDPAIVVLDDMGKFSISLLSGHIGGANVLAKDIGDFLGSIPVITTATDNRGIESVDIFAKRNNYYMEDMKTVTTITSLMVNQKTIGLYTEDDKMINYKNIIRVKDLNSIDDKIEGLIIISSENLRDIKMTIPTTHLIPRNINIGIGCRKGVEGKRIIEAVEEVLEKLNLSKESVQAIGTVEVKKDEEGIIEASKHFNCPMKIFTIDEIKVVEDKFEKSQFVKDTIGVYSVSEPCAYLLGGRLIHIKSKHNGITISISKEIKMAKLYVVGIGPGGREHMTYKAVEVIRESEVIVGYTPYIEYLGDLVEGKELYSTGMKGEIKRCEQAIDMVKKGKITAIVSTGDAGLYGMAGPILELAEGIEVEIVPGVTAAFSAASELGSPIMHDYASISLSDLMTPWEVILKRVEKAAEADFVITMYNPRSKGRPEHLEEAIDLVLKHRKPTTPVGIVKDSGRPGTQVTITTLGEMDYEMVDMLTVLIIGNSNTYIEDDKMITPRGYKI